MEVRIIIEKVEIRKIKIHKTIIICIVFKPAAGSMGVNMSIRNIVIEDLLMILTKVKDNGHPIDDFDKNLFGNYYDYTPGEMLDVCMLLKEKFNICIDEFMHNINEFTVNHITYGLCKILIRDKVLVAND